jgi:hypothetical protein
MQNKYMLKRIFASEQIFTSRTGKYLLQNIRFEANIRKTLSEFHIQANIRLQILPYNQIFACKFLHTSGCYSGDIFAKNDTLTFTIILKKIH